MKTNLNQYIKIQYSQSFSDDTGWIERNWTDKYQVWASIETLYNKRQIVSELAVAKQMQSANYYHISIRYIEDISTDMKIIWGKKSLNISKIINLDNKNQYLILIAQEIIE